MRASFLCAVTVLLMGSAALAQHVTYDFDKTASFATFRTYAWVPGTRQADDFNHARIVSAMNTQLAVKGLRLVDRPAGADLLVAYHAFFDRDLQVTGFSSGWGPYRLGGASAVARTETIVTGTLAIDLVDARTKTIVWRGIVAKEIDPRADAGKRDRTITRAAEKLFKNYPPIK